MICQLAKLLEAEGKGDESQWALCACSSLLRVKSSLSYISNYPYIYIRTHTNTHIYIIVFITIIVINHFIIYIYIYWWQSGSTERNPLCLVMIIPCISCIAPTMYTARFEPAEQICAPHELNIYLYMHKPHPVTYIYIYTYIYITV